LFCDQLQRRCFLCPLAFGWSEAGHHVIARIAFSMMEPEEQQILILMLELHPHWDSESGATSNGIARTGIMS